MGGSPNGAAFALVAGVAPGTARTPTTHLRDWVGWLSLVGCGVFVRLQEVNARRARE